MVRSGRPFTFYLLLTVMSLSAHSISGQAAITDPFLADTELRNKELIRGKIAVIGRGNTQFIHKAQVAVEAGAIGVIFVNTKKRLFDAIHSGNEVGINIPVVTVGLLAQEHLTDGAVCCVHNCNST